MNPNIKLFFEEGFK
jgi:hypothetical protein